MFIFSANQRDYFGLRKELMLFFSFSFEKEEEEEREKSRQMTSTYKYPKTYITAI